MKDSLKRIATTLQQLASQGRSKSPLPPTDWDHMAPANAAAWATAPSEWLEQPESYRSGRSHPSRHPTPHPRSATPLPTALTPAALAPAPAPSRSATALAQPPMQWPQAGVGAAPSQRLSAYTPPLAISLLKEIEAVLSNWQDSLHRVVRQIQDLYQEGPIVDGWLESYNPEPEATIASQPMVAIASTPSSLPASQLSRHTATSHITLSGHRPDPTSGYRLCGLNEQGQVWFRHCPPEQVADISLAIVRHHKLRQLLAHKQTLEARLHQLTEALVAVHGQMNA